MAPELSPNEAQLLATRICDLGLEIANSRLAPGIDGFHGELQAAGLAHCPPHLYLSTEWGVPDQSVSIAIPFYLARAELVALHAKLAGFVEGAGRGDLLRYLRHEMGHVILYAYRLHERQDWAAHFGPFAAPYPEKYVPEPFCAQYVRHLPGWYAQKHPEEDWAESFAVWMTPGLDWRLAYRDWPRALAKLVYCDALLEEVKRTQPLVTAIKADEDVRSLTLTVGEFYQREGVGDPAGDQPWPPGLDGALQAVFEEVGDLEDPTTDAPRLSAANLIRRLELSLVANAFRWTGHFPEEARALIDHLAKRAEALQAVYPADREREAVVALATLVASLAMNHVLRGQYVVERASRPNLPGRG